MYEAKLNIISEFRRRYRCPSEWLPGAKSDALRHQVRHQFALQIRESAAGHPSTPRRRAAPGSSETK